MAHTGARRAVSSRGAAIRHRCFVLYLCQIRKAFMPCTQISRITVTGGGAGGGPAMRSGLTPFSPRIATAPNAPNVPRTARHTEAANATPRTFRAGGLC